MANEVKHSAEVTDDGRLLADSFNIHCCDHCDNAHIDLHDPSGVAFSTATVAPEEFRKVAAWFTQAAVEYEAKTGKSLDA